MNGMWTLVPRNQEDNVISTKWIFKVKPKEDGTIERFKARLVANGMKQLHSVDYLDTFSRVVQSLLIRLVLGLAVTNNCFIHQIDVSNAFLHGKLDECIVVSQPPSFHSEAHPDYVCLLMLVLQAKRSSQFLWAS